MTCVHYSRIERIESQLECGFEKMSLTLSELGGKFKSSDTQDTLEQLTKWNQLDRLPCMCCDKSDSFDKSFFSKEEGKELLCSHSETNLMVHSPSLQCLDLLGQEMSMCFERANPFCLMSTKHNPLQQSSMARSELISFDSTEENTSLDCVSSLDTFKEISFLLGHHSEPLLSQVGKCRQPNRLRLLDSFNLSKSLSQFWLSRFKLSNKWHLVKK